MQLNEYKNIGKKSKKRRINAKKWAYFLNKQNTTKCDMPKLIVKYEIKNIVLDLIVGTKSPNIASTNKSVARYNELSLLKKYALVNKYALSNKSAR